MNIEKMNKKESVNVYMRYRNAWGEITNVALIATFRTASWAEGFVRDAIKTAPKDFYDDLCELYVDTERRYS